MIFIISFISGIIAAFLSLAVSSLISPTQESETPIAFLAVFVLVEEIMKWIVLLFLFTSSSLFNQKRNIIRGAIAFGIGFSVFEIALITLQNNQQESLPLLLILVVHSLTALIVALGIFAHVQKRNKWISVPYLLLAIVIHLCYNLIVHLISA